MLRLPTLDRIRPTVAGVGMVRLPAPFSAGLWRTATETLLGWVIVGLIGVGLRWPLTWGELSALRTMLALAGWVWLLCWPVWRLRRARGRNGLYAVGTGVGHLVLLAAVLLFGLAVLGAEGVRFWPAADGLTSPAHVLGMAVPFALALGLLRALVLVAQRIVRWTGHRLQRQLMISHLASIMITFIGLTALGSVLAVVVVAHLPPDAANEARGAAAVLRPIPGVGNVEPNQSQSLLDGLVSGRLQPGVAFHTPLDRLFSWSNFVTRARVFDRRGRLVAQATNRDAATRCGRPAPDDWLPAPIARPLTARALRGLIATAAVPVAWRCGEPASQQQFAAAPIRTPGGTVAGVVVVQGLSSTVVPGTCLSCTVAVFSASTVAVVGIMVVPTLILSAIAAYLFARGLTGRLRRVSRAAQAMAAGDLSQRVPDDEPNEIGNLARDFNRMAANLEAMMGEVRSARTTAEQALQARQALIASVSHELRTPIAVVRAHLEAIMSPAEPQGSDETAGIPAATLQTMHDELGRLTALVEDLFSLARAESGALRVRCEPTDIGALVRQIAHSLRPLAGRERGIAITEEVVSGLPLGLVDGDRLRQTLANLVRNALRHTPEGGIVALGVAHQAPWLLVTVADTGEGIAPEHLPHIFERFYRVERSRSRNLGGAGLGLAIVQEFVTLMGGHISVQSRLGEGTCFQVSLPLAQGSVAERGRDGLSPARHRR